MRIDSGVSERGGREWVRGESGMVKYVKLDRICMSSEYEYKDMPKEAVEEVFELLDRIERGAMYDGGRGEELVWVLEKVRKEMGEYRVRKI